MAPRKPKPPVEIDEPAYIIPDPNIILISREDLEKALRANMMRITGSSPVVGQLDDLWRRLRES